MSPPGGGRAGFHGVPGPYPDEQPHDPDVSRQRPPLDVVQQWFQAVVTHPAGVAAGVATPAAQSLVRLDRDALERLVRRSSRLTAEQRLSIYANAYYSRLLECLGDCFPVLEQVLGAAVFEGFAFDYLQLYPSRSYTLDRLADNFPRFLEETRPDRPPGSGRPPGPPGSGVPVGTPGSPGTRGVADSSAGASGAASEAPPEPPPSWPDFLIDLATLELAIAKVFDGPGGEGEPLLAPTELPAPDRFAAARLVPVPSLRLLRFRYPVNTFYTAARALAAAAGPGAAGEPSGTALPPAAAKPSGPGELPFPEPAGELVALSRTDFVVRRYTLTGLEFAVLSALMDGARIGEAIAAAAAASDLPDDDLAIQLDSAFRRWTAAGFFRAATA